MTRKRRGRAEGSIYKRADGRWCASVSLGYNAQGKRRRRDVYGKSKAEVQEQLRRLQSDAAAGRLTDGGRITLGEFLTRWLSTVKSSVQPSTWQRYEGIVRLHLTPHLGNVQLAKLAPLHVEQLYATLERAGASARGQQAAGIVLGIALRHAVRLHLIPANPAREIRKPRPAKPRMQAWDAAQARAFLEAAKADRLFAMYALAIDAGMRQGELFALQWADIDFSAGCVSVQRSLEEINGHCRLKETKSAHGRRRIILSDYTVAALHEHRKAMLAEGHASGPVFCDTDGGWLRKGNVLRRSFWPTIERANAAATKRAEKDGSEPALLPWLRFHDLRHTAATLLLAAGESPKVVSERLGHATVALTLDVYSHVLPTMQENAARKMQVILGQAAG